VTEAKRGTPILARFLGDAFKAHIHVVMVNSALHQYKESIAPSGESDTVLLEQVARMIGLAKPVVQNSLMTTRKILKEPALPKTMTDDIDLHGQWCESTLEDLELCDTSIRNAILSKDDYVSMLADALNPYYEEMGVEGGFEDSNADSEDEEPEEEEHEDVEEEPEEGDYADYLQDDETAGLKDEIDALRKQLEDLKSLYSQTPQDQMSEDDIPEDDEIDEPLDTSDDIPEDEPIIIPVTDEDDSNFREPRPSIIPLGTREAIRPIVPRNAGRRAVEQIPGPKGNEAVAHHSEIRSQSEEDYAGLFGYDQYDQPDNPQPLAEDPARLAEIADKASEVIAAVRKKAGRTATKSTGASKKKVGAKKASKSTGRAGARKTSAGRSKKTAQPQGDAKTDSETPSHEEKTQEVTQ